MQKEYNNYYPTVNNSYTCKNRVDIPDCINNDYCVATPFPKNDGILTMAFVDMQPLDSVYSEELALLSGSLFPNLEKPFCGGKNK